MGFVDVHVHLPMTEVFQRSYGRYADSLAQYFRRPIPVKSLAEMLTDFDTAGVEQLVLLGWDAETATSLPPLPNDFLAKVVNTEPKRLIGFASVDPHKQEAAVRELERAVRTLGLRGLKLHPIAQAFAPNDPRFFSLYEKAVELGVPVLFHTGMAAWGAGMPGGGGVRLKYGDPMLLDDVAAEFPDLQILAAHPSWPWQEEGIAVALHKPNVHLDLSGWRPKYIPPQLIQYARSRLQDKVMFGSDYPHLMPRDWVAEFRALGLPEPVQRKILEENARRFLRL